MPSEMAKTYPELWVGEEDDEGKNNFEEEFLSKQIRRILHDQKLYTSHDHRDVTESARYLLPRDSL